MKNILIEKINQSLWWHVPPKNPNAYKKRGRFLASTYLQAEFYGRPNIEPERVTIKNPVFGFSENEILKRLFNPAELSSIGNMENIESNFYKKRIALDAKMCRKARILGYDSILAGVAHRLRWVSYCTGTPIAWRSVYSRDYKKANSATNHC